MAGESKTTIDHKVIQRWAEARGGKPASVKNTENDGEAGVLRIDFPGYSGAGKLEEIPWNEFFKKFDEKKLAFLYQDETSSGEESRFFKLVSRDTAEHKAQNSHDSGTDEKAATHKTDHKAEVKGASHKAKHKSEEKASAHKDDAKASAHKADHKKDEKASAHKAAHKQDEKAATHKSSK